jgi:Holliday junction resolvase-like predicted endonuclease
MDFAFAQLNLFNGVCLTNKTINKSIIDFSCEEASHDVYHTKEDTYFYTSQSGKETKMSTNQTSKENWYLKKKQGKKRDVKKTEVRKAKQFTPHFGVDTMSKLTEQFQELADFANIELPDDILRKVEGIVALLVNLQDCATYQHFMSAVFLYIRDFYNTSVTTQVMTYVRETFNNSTFDRQSDSKDPDWLNVVRDVHTNWTMVKGNKAFKQFSKLMSILVTLGLCDISSLKFDVAGFKLFDEDILKKHMSAYDLADALLGTVTYFVEGAYLCFKTGSIKPLLLNDFSAMELDTEYTNILMWWDLVKNGNLERIVGMSDSEFSNRLNTLILRLSNLITTLSGLDKKIVSDKMIKMKLISNELITLKISSGTRRSPFAIELFGDSNQGKTTFGDQLLDALLTSNSLPIDKQYRAALNPGDKFFSNWTSDKLVAILDDLANEKSDFVEKPPTRAIIDICNNQMYYAPKAELDAKGKCFVEPEIVLVTTNKKDLDAYAYSNCPYSIQRRMDLIMTVRCKPEFQRHVNGKSCGVDSQKVREFYTFDGEYLPPSIDDIWLITVEQAVKPERLSDIAHYSPVVWRGQVMKDVSSIVAIQCAIEYMSTHRLNQIALMDQMRKRSAALTKCACDGCCHLKGFCPDHLFDKQFGLQAALAIESARRTFMERIEGDATGVLGRVESALTRNLYKQTDKFLARWDWMCLVPSECFDNETFVDILHWYYKEDLERQTAKFSYTACVFILLLCFANVWLGFTISILFWIFGVVVAKSRTKKLLVEELKRRNDTLPLVIKRARDTYAKNLCYACAGIAALYALARVYKAWRAIHATHGSLEPMTQSDVDIRDAEVSVWASVCKRKLPTTKFSDSSTPDRVLNSVENNLLYATVNNGKENLMANLLMLTSDVVVIPDHYFDKSDSLRVICRKENADCIGGKFETILCKSASVCVPDTDLRICYTGSGGSFRDITKFFPTGQICDHPFVMTWRKKEGSVLVANGLAKAKRTTNGTCYFAGGEYVNLTIDTFAGLCGAVLVSQTKSPCITGFHLGGKSGTPFGCFGTLTVEQIRASIDQLKTLEGVLLTGKGEKFEPQSFGITMLNDGSLHDKSPLNYLPEGSQFAYYGSCMGATSSRSDVRKTPISQVLTEITGVENIWGPPKMKPEWFGWQTCLANASEPARPFPHDLLIVAVKDYKRPLLEIASKSMWQTQPLTDHQNLNGIPGCKFIDAINLNTSMGYPLTGAKRKYVIEQPSTDDQPNNRIFTQEVVDEIHRVESYYRRGERAYTIAKACKKDEVLPVAKEKCRIFYGNPIALTFLIRKYYLPVLRVLQMNPLKSECAVGINCHGPEWNEFYKHALAHGGDRMFGGDYGKYDQKLPSQLLHAALRILIDISEAMGYSKSDRDIMAAMGGDVVYSLIAVNGDLIGLTSGTHISGNSLTVILNGICGSLNLRCYFYTKYNAAIPFREAAHMMTYGDDNIGSVSPRFPEFNIKGCSEFLAEFGQVYTMPDKESALTEYLQPNEFEFLKRFSVYHTDLGVDVGALLEKSIFKSLHCYLRPKGCPLTPLEASSQNIDGALREWFNHGKEIYELRRTQMRLVAERCKISHMCIMLDESYEDRVLDWKRKYGDDEIVDDDHVFCTQSGYEHEQSAFSSICDKMPMKCIATNAVAFARTIGEIDLIFEFTYEDVRYLTLVEVKSSSMQRAKGKRQVVKYCQAMEILQPSARIFGIVIDDVGWHQVFLTRGSISGWFYIAERSDDSTFKHCLALAVLGL